MTDTLPHNLATLDRFSAPCWLCGKATPHGTCRTCKTHIASSQCWGCGQPHTYNGPNGPADPCPACLDAQEDAAAKRLAKAAALQAGAAARVIEPHDPGPPTVEENERNDPAPPGWKHNALGKLIPDTETREAARRRKAARTPGAAEDDGDSRLYVGPSEQARKNREKLLDGLPASLAAAVDPVLAEGRAGRVAMLQRLAGADSWQGASTAERIDVKSRLHGIVYGELFTAILGKYDQRAHKWSAREDGAELADEPLVVAGAVFLEGDDDGERAECIAPGLAYRGRGALLHARRGRGKTTICAWNVAEATKAGHKALVVTTDDTAGWRRNMRVFGALADNLAVARCARLAKDGALEAAVEEFAPDWIVIDNWREWGVATGIVSAGGFKDTDAAGDRMSRIKALWETGAIAVTLIANQGVASSEDGRSRDSLVPEEAVDLVREVQWSEATKTTTVAPVKGQPKTRPGIDTRAHHWRCVEQDEHGHPVRFEAGDGATSADPSGSDPFQVGSRTDDWVLIHVPADGSEIPQPDLYHLAGRGKMKFNEAVKALLDAGRIVRTGTGKRGDPFLFRRPEPSPPESPDGNGPKKFPSIPSDPVKPTPDGNQTETQTPSSPITDGNSDGVSRRKLQTETPDRSTAPTATCPACFGTGSTAFGKACDCTREETD